MYIVNIYKLWFISPINKTFNYGWGIQNNDNPDSRNISLNSGKYLEVITHFYMLLLYNIILAIGWDLDALFWGQVKKASCKDYSVSTLPIITVL